MVEVEEYGKWRGDEGECEEGGTVSKKWVMRLFVVVVPDNY